MGGEWLTPKILKTPVAGWGVSAPPASTSKSLDGVPGVADFPIGVTGVPERPPGVADRLCGAEFGSWGEGRGA